MSNIGKLDLIEQQRARAIGAIKPHTTWQKFIDYVSKFSVEQMEFANKSDKVKNAFDTLQKEYILFSLLFDSRFNESDTHRPLCEQFVDLFIQTANDYQNDLVNENEELKRKLAQYESASKQPFKGGKNDK